MIGICKRVLFSKVKLYFRFSCGSVRKVSVDRLFWTNFLVMFKNKCDFDGYSCPIVHRSLLQHGGNFLYHHGMPFSCQSSGHGLPLWGRLNMVICMSVHSDILILESVGKDSENIKLGITLLDDQLAKRRFDYQFVNLPYCYEWSNGEATVTTDETFKS